ncbi:hypothetical protein RND71_014805 [Anisodus tanguticus]|uniref:Uncharacterized protein n=1 Tax=Anisodus tanguticus TaxID=243964 RepID=A0AAE1VP08_9SOLA|nr:hypothetical protein RND71_014805 [Anisodus tanguticus]
MPWEEFVKLVDQSLRPHVVQNLRLEQFSLNCRHRLQEVAPHIDRWIDLVVKLNVRVLEIRSFDFRLYYSLPDAIYTAKELTTLTLQEQLQRLIHRCPFIKNLLLEDIQGINKLHVYGLVHLEHLDVRSCKLISMTVQAPNLRRIDYHQEDNLPCKMEIVDAYNTLETLKLEGSSITEQQFQDIFSKHSNISELDLTRCYKLKKMEIASEKFKTLTLSELKNL